MHICLAVGRRTLQELRLQNDQQPLILQQLLFEGCAEALRRSFPQQQRLAAARCVSGWSFAGEPQGKSVAHLRNESAACVAALGAQVYGDVAVEPAHAGDRVDLRAHRWAQGHLCARSPHAWAVCMVRNKTPTSHAVHGMRIIAYTRMDLVRVAVACVRDALAIDALKHKQQVAQQCSFGRRFRVQHCAHRHAASHAAPSVCMFSTQTPAVATALLFPIPFTRAT